MPRAERAWLDAEFLGDAAGKWAGGVSPVLDGGVPLGFCVHSIEATSVRLAPKGPEVPSPFRHQVKGTTLANGFVRLALIDRTSDEVALPSRFTS